ncbi:hypothetical protein MKW98_010935 [Papaver atlanticum]|uniref:Uncharacterized protein n=1 Tax=Papaver atlanticum TaxID=357466 RepID=A0AAD4SLS2_9MAGN|nr:hypothetical protein MKW98_010935 [Papaver atlanticum]
MYSRVKNSLLPILKSSYRVALLLACMHKWRTQSDDSCGMFFCHANWRGEVHLLPDTVPHKLLLFLHY